MPEKFTVCMTGGGTAGHVTPHFALAPEFDKKSWGYFYIGSKGIEKDLVTSRGIRFYTISTGKLRRYLSLDNLLDVFKVVLGCIQAFFILLFHRPNVVFSKGGYVAVPVAVAARLLFIPVVSHESDVTPGLATKIIAKFAKRMIYTFPTTGKYLSSSAIQTGTPIRPELFDGNRKLGLKFCGFSPSELPVILVMGGSQGAMKINAALEAILPELVNEFRIIHLTGAGKGLTFKHANYAAYEYLKEELSDVIAAADIVISRSGANSIFEFLALRKPMLLIPLEEGSRGDQVLNAAEFEKSGWARVLREKDLTSEKLRTAIKSLLAEKDAMKKAQERFDGVRAASVIVDVLSQASGAAFEKPSHTVA
jgi:UDP-N-acetylglucosamine--N-acetylmuramyl-(pentapeptide) pyrophosphoryl-undecaprenol N-acetylglucosamine transferase